MKENAKTLKVHNTFTPLQQNQFKMNTWYILGFLVICLVVIKKFIYIKDESRDGK